MSEATITSPVTPTVATRYVVKDVHILRDTKRAVVTLQMRATTGEVLRDDYEFVIESFSDVDPRPDVVDMQRTNTAISAFIAAIGTTRPTETGSDLRRFQFRVMGYLVDSGLLKGVTLAP